MAKGGGSAKFKCPDCNYSSNRAGNLEAHKKNTRHGTPKGSREFKGYRNSKSVSVKK